MILKSKLHLYVRVRWNVLEANLVKPVDSTWSKVFWKLRNHGATSPLMFAILSCAMELNWVGQSDEIWRGPLAISRKSPRANTVVFWRYVWWIFFCSYHEVLLGLFLFLLKQSLMRPVFTHTHNQLSDADNWIDIYSQTKMREFWLSSIFDIIILKEQKIEQFMNKFVCVWIVS